MARLWARTTTFDLVNVGDELPILVKWETAETIARFAALLRPEPEGPDQAPDSVLEAPPTAASQALLSYVTELLEKGFPLPSITAQGSSLTLQVFAPGASRRHHQPGRPGGSQGTTRRSQLGRVPD